MQRKHDTLIQTGMADPFITAAYDQFIEAFEPAQAPASVQVDEGRIHLLAHRRIPAQAHFSGYGFEDVHAARRNDRNLHDACIDIDDGDTFLTPAMQNAQTYRERLVDFQAEFLAGDLPVLWCFR